MALVRVYCGLASVDPATEPGSTGSALVAAVVDDAGRLLDICEIGDDAAGYAELGSLLAERPGGLTGATIASDSEEHTVVSLMAAAGRPIAIADDDSADDFAERFTDDSSMQETAASPVQRRAVGMARALQAGALSTATLPVPRDLVAYRPVLAAHAALLNGRQAAAAALREVLRELYPAALRAYSNPADPVALAVLNAFPEPGMLPRPDGPDATNRLVAELVADGVADQDTISEAVTALVVAASETPRRGPMPKPVASATVAMVRQAIAAVRAYDAGSAAVVSTITRGADEVPATGRRWTRRTGDTSAVSAKAGPARHAADSTESPTRSASVADSRRASAVDSPSGQPADDRSNYAPASPGRTPSIPTQRTVSPADAGEPFRPTLTTAAINSMRSERQRAKTPRPKAEQTAPSGEFGPADYSVPIPTPRPDKPQSSPPGSRANWPLVNSSDDDRAKPVEDRPSDGQSDRVRPPWLDDDLPPEPPMLRLVEPSLPEAPPEQPERSEAKSLRLVESDAAADWSAQTTEKRGEETDHRLPPVSDDGDDDLLIFAATRSAWFTGRPQESNLEWRSSADPGWQAAEQAAKPTIREQTRAGLPKRVPQANLVPGSPLRDERPLRIVRNADRIAENASGYFQGWRRGQQIGGYAVGGRPGRESAGWDFTREHEQDDSSEYEYRSARY